MTADALDPDDGLLLPVGAEPVEPPQSATKFRDVHHFVTDYPGVMWARTVRETDHGFRWCPQWDQHPAAVERLTALWQAYEALHRDGETGPSSWWTHHADVHHAALTAPDGPLARCRPGRHQAAPSLPSPRKIDGSGVRGALRPRQAERLHRGLHNRISRL
jgi:hypothetical protein